MIHWQGGQIWKYKKPLMDTFTGETCIEHYLFVDSRPSPTSNLGNDVHRISVIILETGEVDTLIVKESTFLHNFTRVDDEPALSSR